MYGRTQLQVLVLVYLLWHLWRVLSELKPNDKIVPILATIANRSTFKLELVVHDQFTNREATEMMLNPENVSVFYNTKKDEINSDLFPRTFKYLINNSSLCSSPAGHQLRYVLCFYSAPQHFNRREVIRKTFAMRGIFPDYPSRHVFLLGRPNSSIVQYMIQDENRQYGDIVQSDFLDSYHNLSYKGILQLQWVKDFCSNARYLIKIDDDVYPDMFQVLFVLDELEDVPRFIAGRPLYNSPVHRSGRWAIGSHLMPALRKYPFYFQGHLYILPTSIVPELLAAAMMTPVLTIDDAYITGVVAGQLDIEYIQFKGIRDDFHYLPTYPHLVKGTDSVATLWCLHLSFYANDTLLRVDEQKLWSSWRAVDCDGALDGLNWPLRNTGANMCHPLLSSAILPIFTMAFIKYTDPLCGT